MFMTSSVSHLKDLVFGHLNAFVTSRIPFAFYQCRLKLAAIMGCACRYAAIIERSKTHRVLFMLLPTLGTILLNISVCDTHWTIGRHGETSGLWKFCDVVCHEQRGVPG